MISHRCGWRWCGAAWSAGLIAWLSVLFAPGLWSAEPARILVLGDSLSAAYGLSIDQGWVALLGDRLGHTPELDGGSGFEVINASLSGETTAGGLERLPALLAEHHPSVVIIALGANDGLRGFALADIGARLERLITTGRAAGARVILAGVRLPPNYGAGYGEGFQQLFAELAERTGVVLVPRLLAGVAENWDLMQADGLHPTAAAQPIILETVWPAVRAVLARASSTEQRAAEH